MLKYVRRMNEALSSWLLLHGALGSGAMSRISSARNDVVAEED